MNVVYLIVFILIAIGLVQSKPKAKDPLGMHITWAAEFIGIMAMAIAHDVYRHFGDL